MLSTLVTRVIVCCSCGTLALNDHPDAQTAWTFAATHVALTGKCTPTMHRDTITVRAALV